jgi:hypothetical protein
MCEPATILAASSLALTATGIGLDLEGQRRNASAQQAQQQRLVEASNTEAALQLSQLRIEQAQSRESTARESEKARLASQKSKATAVTAAGQAGVQGNSVDAVLQEYSANLGQFKETTMRQRQLEDSSFADKSAAIQSGARYQNLQINGPVTGPNYAAGLAKLGGAALGTYKDYNPTAFEKAPKDPKPPKG